MTESLEIRPTIDRAWLESAGRREPLTHAYALWDLERTPQAVRFVSALRHGATVAYLMVWMGRRDRPVVHWFGEPEAVPALRASLPPPPFVAIVPPDAEPRFRAGLPVAQSYGLKLMVREPGPLPRAERSTRRLRRSDAPRLAELIRSEPTPELAAYPALDLEVEPVWGAFDVERLVGVARAAVRRPELWVVSGVYVTPGHRGQGLGRGLVAAIAGEAEGRGARTGLFARDEPSPALQLYEGLGFREIGRRSWLEVVPASPGRP